MLGALGRKALLLTFVRCFDEVVEPTPKKRFTDCGLELLAGFQLRSVVDIQLGTHVIDCSFKIKTDVLRIGAEFDGLLANVHQRGEACGSLDRCRAA